MFNQPTEDDLRDLSPADYRELEAFLNKRRWFEEKLAVLQAVEPLYPFLHPRLQRSAGSGGQYERVGEADSEWKLPSLDQVLSWKAERNALEAEVFAFDGGDLGRMKSKTREITLVPLPPSATHLVSVTLDLIVLVDLLLGLLRKRFDLLELVELRLRWDDKRWMAMRIYEELHTECQASLAIDWTKEETGVAQTRLGKDNLEATSRSVKTAQEGALRESGALLDRMIDRAASMVGLGDEHGPSDLTMGDALAETMDGQGAVPDSLLAAQETLEADFSTLQGMIESSSSHHEDVLRQWDSMLLWEDRAADMQQRMLSALSILQSGMPEIPTPRCTLAVDDYGSSTSWQASISRHHMAAVQVAELAVLSLNEATNLELNFLKITGRPLGTRTCLHDSMGAITDLSHQVLNEPHQMVQLGAILPETCGLAKALAHSRSNLDELVSATRDCLSRSMWTADNATMHTPQATDLVRRIADVDTYYETWFRDPLEKKKSRFAGQSVFLWQCRNATEAIAAELRSLRKAVAHMERCERQAEVVRSVQSEAATLQSRIAAAIQAGQEDVMLLQEAQEWDQGLADRVPFPSTSVPASITTPRRPLDASSSVAQALLTPPLSRSSSSASLCSASARPDLDLSSTADLLVATDAAVRAEVNRLSAKVASAVQRFRTCKQDIEGRLLAEQSNVQVDYDDRECQLEKAEEKNPGLVEWLHEAAAVVQSDPRVLPEVKRIDDTRDVPRPVTQAEARAAQGLSPSVVSISQRSVAARQLKKDPKSPTPSIVVGIRTGLRSTSSPFQTHSYADPTSASRSRSVSSTDLSRLRTASMRLSRPNVAEAARHSPATVSYAPRASRRTSLASVFDNTPRKRLSTIASSTPRVREKSYLSDPNNRLDVAVGRIVNKLDVHVPIVPADPIFKDEWKDESGRYWIGAEGRAKLCFCRILRSRTVMVRVGGGWVELSKFLLDHFAETASTLQPPDQAPLHTTSNQPVSITSANEASMGGAVTPSRPRGTSEPRIPRPRTTSARSRPLANYLMPLDPYTTPQKGSLSHSLSRLNVGDSPDQTPPSADTGNPLVPLQFIKRAGDSPPEWLKEREKLHVGRRSFLGKRTSLGSKGT